MIEHGKCIRWRLRITTRVKEMDDVAALVKELDGMQEGWWRLFGEIEQRETEPSVRIGQLPQNRYKNRYINIFPVDDTRVILGNPESDYINANHIKIDGIDQKYILAQGPVKYSCTDFWQMAWEQHASGIVMLNQIHELCDGEMYWGGDDVSSTIVYPPFVVTLMSISHERIYTIRKFELRNTKSNTSRSVTHFHFTKWPDYGVPKSPDDFVSFWAAVRKSGLLESEDSPCIVHCTGGVGRSGTFCFVDVILQKVKKMGTVKVEDLPNTLLQLRKQRYWLIQTPDQLRFAYHSILGGSELVLKERTN